MASQVFYEIARWRLDEQLAQIRELNDRLVGIFTAATALLVLFAAFQGFNSDIGDSTLVLLSAGAAVYVLLVVVTVLGLRDRPLVLGPSLQDIRALSAHEGDSPDPNDADSHNALTQWAAEEFLDAVTANERSIRRKATFAGFAIWLWGVDVLILAAAALNAVV